jgi:hypothetical protein
MKLLRGLPWVAALEKASIDEAYLLLLGSTEGAAGAAGTGGWGEEPDGEPGGDVSAAAALQRAREAKAEVQRQLGLCVSVGAAPNRLLAKLASAAAKPDGVLLVPDQAAARELLSRTPASRLPGYGGKAAEAFERREEGTGRCSREPQHASRPLQCWCYAAARLPSARCVKTCVPRTHDLALLMPSLMFSPRRRHRRCHRPAALQPAAAAGAAGPEGGSRRAACTVVPRR